MQLQLFSDDLPAPALLRRAGRTRDPERQLREALTPYLDLPTLQRLAATSGADLRQALVAGSAPPSEVTALLTTMAVLLTPGKRAQIRGPADVAGLLMFEMGYLDQEQLRVVCLDTKNRIKKIHLVYQGSVNSALIRIGEVFKEPLRLNCPAILLCHNHPSGDTTPSPEDIAITRQIVEAGKLLDVELLDHIILGAGSWTSLRGLNQGFEQA